MSRSPIAVFFESARRDKNNATPLPIFERHSHSDTQDHIRQLLSRLAHSKPDEMSAMSLEEPPNADAAALLAERMQKFPDLFKDATPEDVAAIERLNNLVPDPAKPRRKKNGQLDEKRVAALVAKPPAPDYFWLDETAVPEDNSEDEAELAEILDDDGDDSAGADDDDDDDDENSDSDASESGAGGRKKRRKSEAQRAPRASKAGGGGGQNATPLSKGKKVQIERKRVRKEELATERGKERLQKAAADYIYVAAANLFQRKTAADKDTPLDRTFAQIVRDDTSDSEQITRLKRSLAAIELELFNAVNVCVEGAPIEAEIIRDLVNDAVEVRQLELASNAVNATNCAIIREPVPADQLTVLEMVRPSRKPVRATVCKLFQLLVADFCFIVNPMAHAEALVAERLRHIRGFVNGKTTFADTVALLVNDPTKAAATLAFAARYKIALDRVDTFFNVLGRARALSRKK